MELDTTSYGHYYLLVNDSEIEVHNINLATEEKSFDQKKKMIHKLHRQFAHSSDKNLTALMKSADVFNSDCEEIIHSISEKCEVCKRFKRTPCCLVVCLPLATKFNQVVGNRFETVSSWNVFITFYRFFTRCSSAEVIRRKLP